MEHGNKVPLPLALVVVGEADGEGRGMLAFRLSELPIQEEAAAAVRATVETAPMAVPASSSFGIGSHEDRIRVPR